MGKPVIASAIGGISEVIQNGENGYLVEPGNVDQLTEAINNIWSDRKNYRRFCENTRQTIVKNYNRTAQFKKFLDYFHNIYP